MEFPSWEKHSILEHKLNWLCLGGLAHLCPLRRGFLKLIQLVLRTQADGLIHCGPPCSSWVWVNRATAKRSRDSPAGDTSIPSVASGNLFLGFNIIWIWSNTRHKSTTNHLNRIYLSMEKSHGVNWISRVQRQNMLGCLSSVVFPTCVYSACSSVALFVVFPTCVYSTCSTVAPWPCRG
jgi:hypothetical protein